MAFEDLRRTTTTPRTVARDPSIATAPTPEVPGPDARRRL